jgi:hypothetical protein
MSKKYKEIVCEYISGFDVNQSFSYIKGKKFKRKKYDEIMKLSLYLPYV